MARLFVFALFAVATPGLALAQAAASLAPAALTADDYARAERFLAAAVNPLVVGGTVNAAWLPDDRFTYRSSTGEGGEFMLVDPVKKTRERAFDHERLAAALATASGTTVDAKKLPFQTIELSADGTSVAFDVGEKRYSCDVKGAACASIPPKDANAVISPDGTRAVFIKDWNLWVRDLASKVERPLTTDGVANFGYATDNAGWRASAKPIVLWSPDSKKVATFQQDERTVGDMYLVETKAGHPVLKAWKYPLPGDDAVAMLHRVVIDTDSGAVVRFQMPPDYHRAMLGDDVSVRDWSWSPDASRFAFVSTSRDHKKATVLLADAASGVVRTVFEESAATQLESPAGWRVLWTTNEILWNSAARRLESSLPLRPDHRPAQAPDHLGPRAGDGRPARRREDAHGVLHGQRPRAQPGPVLHALLPHRARRQGLRRAHARGRLSQRADVADRPLRDRRGVHARACAGGRDPRPGGRGGDAAREGRRLEAGGRGMEAADAASPSRAATARPTSTGCSSGPPTSMPARSTRSSTTPIRDRRAAASGRGHSWQHAATTRRWPSSASWSSPSTAWAHRGARSRSTTPTTAPWAATTRCPTRWRA